MISTPVRDVLNAATITAARPVDHLRRAGTGLFVGNCVGTVVGILVFGATIGPARLALVGAILLGLSALFLSPWLTRQTVSGGEVVARTLATEESLTSRTGRFGLKIPVVAKPVDGGPAFRSIITVKEEPSPGTLFAMRQRTEGQGELAACTPSQAQRDLMDRLARHPKELANTAPILPSRRSPLDPHPWWAAASLATSAVVGFALAMAMTGAIA